MHRLAYIFLWVFRFELPGWGKLAFLQARFGPFHDKWNNSKPRIIRDKIHHQYRVLNMSEWSDRLLYFLGRWYELETELVIRKFLKDGDSVLDVGANYGHFTLAAKSLTGINGTVIAIEPNPYSFGRLATHIVLNNVNNVHIHNIGLASKNGNLLLKVPRVNTGEATFGRSQYLDDEVSTFSCDVKTGDEITNGIDIKFVKIDVEGFECEVLSGLRDTINRSKPHVYLECIERHLEAAGSSVSELLELMHGFGYKGFSTKLYRKSLLGKHRLSLLPISNFPKSDNILWVHESKCSDLSP